MLTELQIKFLKNFGMYKSSGRRDQWERYTFPYGVEAPCYDNLIEELVTLGFLKKNKAGAVMRTKLGYSETGSSYGAEAQAGRQMSINNRNGNQAGWDSVFKKK